jgi:hypothetical protein
MLLNMWYELLDLIWATTHKDISALTPVLLLLILLVLIFKKGSRS